MQTLSRTTLIGYLGGDPETKEVGGKKKSEFQVATNFLAKNDQGEKEQEAEWHNIELWGRENLLPFLKKGTPVWIEGYNKTSTWETNGVKKNKTVVVVEELGLLDSKKA